MIRIIPGILLVTALTSPSGAALLFLTNAGTGEDYLDLVTGGSGDMNIMLTIRAIDTGFAFANVFLNDNDDSANGVVDVTELTEGIGTIYDRTWFTLPADISYDQDNEYSLLMGAGPDGGGDTWGPGTYVLDTLTLTQTEQSDVDGMAVAFEKGERAPQIDHGAFTDMPWGLGFDNIIPNFADPGVGGEDNPFIINLSVPEPSALVLMALGGLALARRSG